MTDVHRILTSGDFATLSRLAEDWRTAGHSHAPLARRILETAQIVFPSDLPADVASLGTRLEYSAGDGRRSTAELTALCLFERDYMPLRHPLGLALLGRREGADFDVMLDDGTTQRVRLERILQQPERTWPGRFSADGRGLVKGPSSPLVR